jgi:hypothetical protein
VTAETQSGKPRKSTTAFVIATGKADEEQSMNDRKANGVVQ